MESVHPIVTQRSSRGQSISFPRYRLGALLSVSGCCLLIYQGVWLRWMEQIFGVSASATMAAQAVLFGCLAGGGLWAARRRQPADPLAAYARLELGIAVTAAIGPGIVAMVGRIYYALGGSFGLGWATLPTRMLLAAMVIGGPATLAGAVLPTLARTPCTDSSRIHGFMGFYLLGLSCGALLGPFVVHGLLGYRRTLWLACAVGLLSSMVARNLSRRAAEREPTSHSPHLSPATEDLGSPPPWALTCIAGLLGGSVALALAVWQRMLEPLIGDNALTAGLTHALLLLGATLGVLAFARGIRGRSTLGSSATGIALLAGALIAPLAVPDFPALAAIVLRPMDVMGIAGTGIAWTLVIACMVLPAAVLLGHGLATVLGLRRRPLHDLGLLWAGVGSGAVLGILAAPAGLAHFGAAGVWRLVTQVLAGGALVLGTVSLKRASSPHNVVLAVLVPSLVLGSATLVTEPSALWRHGAIAAGEVPHEFEGPNVLKRFAHSLAGGIPAQRETAEGTVALVAGHRPSLIVDGIERREAGGPITDLMIGSALHGAPRSVLWLGAWTQQAVDWLAGIPSLERVDAVGIEPMPIATDPALELSTGGPSVRWIRADSREWISTQETTYDLVLTEPIDVFRARPSRVFSVEFYAAARGLLRPGGLLLQPIRTRALEPRALQAGYATVESAFPAVETWQTGPERLLWIAGPEPLSPNPESLTQTLSRDPWRAFFRQHWGVDGIDGLYTAFIGSHALSDTLKQPARVSTDDRPTFEHRLAWPAGPSSIALPLRIRDLAKSLQTHHPSDDIDLALDWSRIQELEQASMHLGELPVHSNGVTDAQTLRMRARAAWKARDLSTAVRLWPELDGRLEPPICLLDQLMLAELSMEPAGFADPTDPTGLLIPLRADAPVEVEVLKAVYAHQKGRIPSAIGSLRRAFDSLRRHRAVHRGIVERGFELASTLASLDHGTALIMVDALAEPFADHAFEPMRSATRIEITGLVDLGDDCRRFFADYEPFPQWSRRFLEARARCYTTTARTPADESLIADAERDLKDFLHHSPPELDLQDGGMP